MGMQFGFGAGLLYGTRIDIANQTPVRFGAMQDVSIDFDGELKELWAQSQYAIDAARGKTKISGKAKVAQLSAFAFNNLYFGGTLTTGKTLSAYNEVATVVASTSAATSAATASGDTLTFTAVPATAVVGALVFDTTTAGVVPTGATVIAVTATTAQLSAAVTGGGVLLGDSIKFLPPVTPANTSYAGDLGVYYSLSGTQLVFTITTPPAVGEYAEVGGKYYFADADAGLQVLLNYIYTDATSGSTVVGGNPFMGTTPKFTAVFTETYNGQTITLQLMSCVANKLTLPTKIDDYMIPEIDFMAYANAAGQTFTISTT